MAKKDKKAKEPKPEKEKKAKKEKKPKEMDAKKAAQVHGMRFAGAQKRKASMNVFTGMAVGMVLALGGATAYAYLQAAKIAPGEGPMDVVKLQEEGRIQLPGGR